MTMPGDSFTPAHLHETLKQFPCTGRYLVAFSGGADSTALLLAASEINDLRENGLHAIHINHHFHNDSNHWQEHCQSLCDRLGIPFANLDLTDSPRPGESPEAELRKFRYRAFESILQTGDSLLMAHHRDDQAETLLLNLMRGTGIDGIAGIPRQRQLGKGQLLRPLLEWPREALIDYLRSKKIEWLEDSSNLDTRFDRNFIRQKVIPVLKERWPSVSASLATTSTHAREASHLLQDQARSFIETHQANPRVLNLVTPSESQIPFTKLVIRHWTSQAGAPPIPGARIQEFCRQIVAAQSGSCSELNWADWTVRYFNQRLWLNQGGYQSLESRCWDGNAPLRLGKNAGELKLNRNSTTDLNLNLRIRSKQQGETMRISDRTPTRKIKELLRVAGVPPWLRDQVPVALIEDRVAAVGDFIVSDELRGLLDQSGSQLAWTPADPALSLVHSETG